MEQLGLKATEEQILKILDAVKLKSIMKKGPVSDEEFTAIINQILQ